MCFKLNIQLNMKMCGRKIVLTHERFVSALDANITCLSRVHLALATSVAPQVSARELREFAAQVSSLIFILTGEAGLLFSAVPVDSLSIFILEVVGGNKSVKQIYWLWNCHSYRQQCGNTKN